MLLKKSNGQEAIEFILISTLVFFGALFTMFVFGEKISNLFTSGSASSKASATSAPKITSNTPQSFKNDYETSVTTDQNIQVVDINGTDIAMTPEGDAILNIQGQDIFIPKASFALQETVIDSTGASGTEDVIEMVSYMVNKYKSDYPDQDVPVELNFGQGNRHVTLPGQSIEYKGSASVNTTAVKVGNNVLIYQKDQDCNAENTTCLFQGDFKIEGSYDQNNNFTGYAQSINQQYNPRGQYRAKVDLSNGINFINSNFHQTDTYNSVSIDFQWDINFDNPANNFKL